MLSGVLLCMVLCCALFHYVALGSIVLCLVCGVAQLSCRILLCHVVLCSVVLLCVVYCCVELYRMVLCRVVLFCIEIVVRYLVVWWCLVSCRVV